MGKMMKLVVLAVAVSAVCGSVIPLGGYHGGLVAGPYSGLVAGGAIGYSGLPVGYSGLPVGTVSHTGYSVAAGPEVHGVAPPYVAGPAPAIVAPQPYSVHTGTKVDVAAEPVEQHGYVIKYYISKAITSSLRHLYDRTGLYTG